MKRKDKSLAKSDRGFDSQKFWRHYVATVDTDEQWEEDRPQQGRGSSRLFLFLLLFHIFLIGSVVLFNLVSDRPKPVFVDNSLPSKTGSSTKKDKAPVATSGKTGTETNGVPATKAETVEHRVSQADTMKSIASTYGTTQDEIARMNHIDVSTPLAVGSVLRVPKPKDKPMQLPPALQPARVEEKIIAAQTTTTLPTNSQMFAAMEPVPSPKNDKVESTASMEFKAETIASKPPEEKPKVKVEDSPPPAPKPKATETKAVVRDDPPKATETKAAAKPEPAKPAPSVAKATPTTKPAVAKTAEPAKAAAAKPSASTRSHTVKPKDTFYSISRKYGVNVNDLMKINGVTDPGKLREGTVLKVPAAK